MWRSITIIVLAATSWIWGSAASNAQEPTRIALLIGNQTYAEKAHPLSNPHNDIKILGAALKSVGFHITLVEDADLSKIKKSVGQYVEAVQKAGPEAISFFYYSGHGATDPSDNINYLIPVNVQTINTTELWMSSYKLQDITYKLNSLAPDAVHFVVFDACRNELNLASLTTGIDETRGFTPFKKRGGMLIFYSAARKKPASDSGVFAEILSSELTVKGITAYDMFQKVRLRVKKTLNQDSLLSTHHMRDVYLGNIYKNISPEPTMRPNPPMPPDIFGVGAGR
jgi:uncharacterized caspase-like protein